MKIFIVTASNYIKKSFIHQFFKNELVLQWFQLKIVRF